MVKKIRKYLIRGAILGLTLISVTAGFDFYSALFGMSTAVLCCVIFEVIRLGCLWSFTSGWSSKVAAVPVYIVVAATCALAGITSFHARIIESGRVARQPWEKIIMKNTELIKSAYAQKTANDLKVLDGKIDVCRQKLAASPESKYW